MTYLNFPTDSFEGFPEVRVCLHVVLDAPAGMNHGRMILTAEIPAYRCEGMPRQLFAEVHTYMTRLNNLALSPRPSTRSSETPEVFAGDAADFFHGRFRVRVDEQFAQHFPDERDIYFAPVQCGVRQ